MQRPSLSQIGYVVRFLGVVPLFYGVQHGAAYIAAGATLIILGTGLRAYGFFGRGGLDGRPRKRA